MEDSVVYKILSRDELDAFKLTGAFTGAGADSQDGFIHLSSASQVAGTVERYFHGRSDILILAVDTSGFGPSLRWEASRGGALFPHLYGVLPYEAVLAAGPVEYLEDGRLKLPQ